MRGNDFHGVTADVYAPVSHRRRLMVLLFVNAVHDRRDTSGSGDQRTRAAIIFTKQCKKVPG